MTISKQKFQLPAKNEYIFLETKELHNQNSNPKTSASSQNRHTRDNGTTSHTCRM